MLALAMAAVALCGCGKREAPLPPDAVVLAFGDSLTEGCGADAAQDYPAVLATLLGCKVVNGGVSGENSGDGAERLPGLLREVRPSVVVICTGGNDFLRSASEADVARNLRRMVEACRAADAKVVLLGVPRPGLILRAAPLYAELARQARVPYDGLIVPHVLSSPTLKSDLIHPNAEGYRRIAEAVARRVREAAAE